MPETNSYQDFCAYCANYGFPLPVLTEEQFNSARLMGADDGAMYGIVCDVNAGVDFNVAAKLNIQRSENIIVWKEPAPTMNKVDMLNCAQGLHDYGDDSFTCRVCGHETPPAITTSPAEQWALVVGDVMNGVFIVGPFNDADAATSHGEEVYHGQEWHVTRLHNPER